MFFKKSKEEVDKSVWKIDKLVTWLIIWWALGSIFGMSRWKNENKDVTRVVVDSGKVAGKAWLSILGKILIKILSIFDKKR